MLLKPGTLLGPYEVLAPIEVGGMGSVFRARDSRLQRVVALKVLPVESMKDEKRLKRFQREARAAAALTHPNIVALYDVGEAEVTVATPFGDDRLSVQFLVEEFVEGSSLRRLLRAGRLPLARIIDIAAGILHGLRAAHEKGLVHRDLKPENILIDLKGRPKIADFGLVRWIYPETAAPSEDPDWDSGREGLTRTGYVVGTLGYMSPEQARGEDVGPASDLFVFGILIYELLSGLAPFARGSIDESFQAILKETPPSLLERVPDAPPRLVAIVERCLEKKPSNRYPGAEPVLREIEVLRRELRLDRADTDPRALSVLPVVRTNRFRKEASPFVWFAAAAAVLVAFTGGWVLGRGRREVPPSPWTSSVAWTAEAWRGAPGLFEPEEAALTPDGRRLAVTAADGSGSGVFYAALRGGGEPRHVSTNPSGGRAPFVSRDGASILFSDIPAEGVPGVWEADLKRGGAPRLLAPDGEEPALSPDGRLLAYVRRREGASEIWLARRDGSAGKRFLSSPRAEWRFPAFTGDGAALVFYEVRSGVDTLSGSGLLIFAPLADPRPVPFGEGRAVDPGGRPAALDGGGVLVRSWGDRSALLFERRDAPPLRLPFGASLAALSATRDGRSVIGRTAGGPFVIWRRW